MRTVFGLVLAAAFASSTLALAQAPQNRTAPRALQTEFDGFITRFRAALTANDSAAVARMTQLPFEHGASYPDAATFRARAYPAIFTAAVRACIQRERGVYDRDGENNDSYFIFCGQKIFIFTKTPSGFLFKDIGAND